MIEITFPVMSLKKYTRHPYIPTIYYLTVPDMYVLDRYSSTSTYNLAEPNPSPGLSYFSRVEKWCRLLSSTAIQVKKGMRKNRAVIFQDLLLQNSLTRPPNEWTNEQASEWLLLRGRRKVGENSQILWILVPKRQLISKRNEKSARQST